MSLVFVLILHDMKGMGSWACIVFSYFLMGLDIILAEALVRLARWASTSVASFLVISMSLQAVILAVLAH